MNVEIHKIEWLASDAEFDGNASANSDYIDYDSGLVSLYLPTQLRSFAMQASGGNVDMVNSDYTDGDPVWTVSSEDKEALDGTNFAGTTVYFNASEGAILQLRLLKY